MEARGPCESVPANNKVGNRGGASNIKEPFHVEIKSIKKEEEGPIHFARE